MTAMDTLRELQPKIKRADSAHGDPYYIVEGYPEPFPSVTTILNAVVAKPGLVLWARNVALDDVKQTLYGVTPIDVPTDFKFMWNDWVDKTIEKARKRPDEVRDQAADFGTRSHTLINDCIFGNNREIPVDLSDIIMGFLNWRDLTGLHIVPGEMMVYHPKLHYAGTLDAIGERDGQLVSLHFVAADAIHPEHFLQVAGYLMAIASMLDQGMPLAPESWVLRFGKTSPSFEAVHIPDLWAAMEGFRCASGLYRALEQLKVPKGKAVVVA